MTDPFDIFKKLRDCEADPPPEVMRKVFKSLDEETEIQRNAAIKGYYEHLQELEVNPPVNAFMFIKNKIDYSFKLSFLQNLEIAPPSSAFTSIIDNVNPHSKLKKQGRPPIIRALYNYRSVAVVLLLVIAGWIIYRTVGSSGKPEDALAKSLLPAPAKDSAFEKADPATPDKDVAGNTHRAGMVHIISGDYHKLSVGEYTFPVMDNDILSAFTAFSYNQVPDFINSDNSKKFTVKLDHYTAISVSEGMSGMIIKMNSFRRNGKLTHRAKKTRSLLEKWKKKDALQFDKSLMNNPIDAIDLAEFIFK